MKSKPLFSGTVDPLTTLELPLEDIDPLNTISNTDDAVAVTTFISNEKQGA